MHDCTYQYILVRTGTELFTKVRTSAYFSVSIAVHGSTWRYKAVHDKFYHGLLQYMTVHGSISFILSRFMAVYGGTLQYMTGFPPACYQICSLQTDNWLLRYGHFKVWRGVGDPKTKFTLGLHAFWSV